MTDTIDISTLDAHVDPARVRFLAAVLQALCARVPGMSGSSFFVTRAMDTENYSLAFSTVPVALDEEASQFLPDANTAFVIGKRFFQFSATEHLNEIDESSREIDEDVIIRGTFPMGQPEPSAPTPKPTTLFDVGISLGAASAALQTCDLDLDPVFDAKRNRLLIGSETPAQLMRSIDKIGRNLDQLPLDVEVKAELKQQWDNARGNGHRR